MVCGNHQQHVTDDVHIAKPRTSYNVFKNNLPLENNSTYTH